MCPSSSSAKGSKGAMHWFRKGLRIHDNPALVACLEQSPQRVYPVFVLDGNSYQLLRCTALRANFLVETLQDLDENLRALGSRLYVLKGDPTKALPKFWKEFNITHMSFEEDESGEPYAAERDEKIIEKAQKANVRLFSQCTETMYPLKDYVTKAGAKGVPATMTGFQKLFKSMKPMSKVLPAPEKEDFPDMDEDDLLAAQYLPPKRPTDLPWPRGIPKSEVEPLWGPKDCKNLTPIVHGGETLARKALTESLKRSNWVATFEKPKTSCTSLAPSTTALSPYLSWGCLSPREVWFALDEAVSRASSNVKPSKPPVSLHGQMLWRDFNNLMAHDANKEVPGCWNKMEGNKYCRQIPWDDDPRLLEAWKTGKTGFPWIDAAMRQLTQEGWIHHLGRHAVACFLTRGDLWQSWEEGAKHFEAELLDADYALNGFNWLWLSCSGFFFQYFRCYSPIVFQKKNDPNGQYIRKFVPELKDLPSKYIYEPWEAPASVLQKAGVKLGKTYPRPLVDHAVISKENMNRMKQAYDAHKARAQTQGGAAKKKQRK
ncbi:Cryptochrome-1 [Seminavis robusta]|uniref:Cryptochrome-1 n=1 Tax=Seminavis robusta TaxID=568900 RepID=A0A9N8DCW5_9STRA|nr:Cryptochrome-1 [Seminavis robusta]|eukprot:Sro82_g043740.1 Cryptochrome-1 (544) ;mRNA; r:23785-25416